LAQYDFGIVVGINDYDSFPSLQGAVNDAEYFYAWLISPEGGDVPPGNVAKLISSDTPGEPRRDQIENAIVRHIRAYKLNGPPIGTRLYLFFSGHGIDVGNLEDCGLVMADANDFMAERTVPGRVLATAYKHSQAFSEVLLFMDCCREVTMQNPLAGQLPLLANLPKVATSDARLLSGLATQWRLKAGERALPMPDSNGQCVQGIFTYALLDGLKRAGGPDGAVTGELLKNYVATYMNHLGAGTPIIEVEPEEIVICRPGPGKTRLIVTLPVAGLNFEVLDGGNFGQAVDAQRTQLGSDTWALPVRPGLYLIGAPSGRPVDGYDYSKRASVVGAEYVVEL
jgi:hypothetical protein